MAAEKLLDDEILRTKEDKDKSSVLKKLFSIREGVLNWEDLRLPTMQGLEEISKLIH